ncbi:MAG: ribosomal protein S18-alanine N-acetyltransferase [Chloroflexi bacterium]|nr:ribosomal protein S18-alanine N-acetyltransferase [Chloroflexota bacterium]
MSTEDPTAPLRLYLLRTANADDLDQLAGLERAVFPTVWPPTNFAREIKKSGGTVLVVAVRSEAGEPGRVERGASLVERVIGGIRTLAAPGGAGRPRRDRAAGWVVVWFVAGEAHIASIGVAESDRRRGVGELLVMGAVEAAAANACDELTLEVRKSNEAAQALYHKYGFREVGERKGYYVDDSEDALILTTPDIREPEYATLLADLASDHTRRWEKAGIRFERS